MRLFSTPALLVPCGHLIRELSLPMLHHNGSKTEDSKYKHRKNCIIMSSHSLVKKYEISKQLFTVSE